MKPKEYLKTLYRWINRRQTTYSQTGEDVIANFFLAGVKQGFYVDIGANDPIYLNNTYFFYKKGWSGICVEPNRFRSGVFKKVRGRDRVLNIGVGPIAGSMNFYEFYPDTFSTFASGEVERYKKLGYQLIGTSKVQVETLENIFNNHASGRPVHLLSLDTEGDDLAILKSNDWAKFRPKLVIAEVVEHHGDHGIRQNLPFDQFMSDVGYLKLADTYINTIYIEKEFAKEKQI